MKCPTIVGERTTGAILSPGIERTYRGDFGIWSSSVTDGGDLSVTGATALEGSWGMQAVIDDNTAIYVTDNPGLLFSMSWAGADDLTSVGGYDLEYKLGAGNWTRWLSNISET